MLSSQKTCQHFAQYLLDARDNTKINFFAFVHSNTFDKWWANNYKADQLTEHIKATNQLVDVYSDPQTCLPLLWAVDDVVQPLLLFTRFKFQERNVRLWWRPCSLPWRPLKTRKLCLRWEPSFCPPKWKFVAIKGSKGVNFPWHHFYVLNKVFTTTFTTSTKPIHGYMSFTPTSTTWCTSHKKIGRSCLVVGLCL